MGPNPDAFMLRIALGNDSMREPAHVAEALHHAAQRIERVAGSSSSASSWDGVEDGAMVDGNGNTVGAWWVELIGRG